MQTTNQNLPRTHIVYTIAIIGFIYTLHYVLPMYSNSSFLSVFANERLLSIIYMAGAAVSVLCFLLAPTVIRKAGNYVTTLWLIIIQAILFYGLITVSSPIAIVILFVLQTAVISLIGLALDIFLEVYTDSEHVGTVRGMYTAILNASWVIAPLIGTLLISGTNNYHNTYIAALAILLPLFYLVYKNFPRFKDPNYTHLSPWQLVKHIGHNRNWIKLFSANLILQTFYSWMVIYCPIYLNKTMGFSWEDIGIILTIMLLPFPLIQYPLGRLADKRYGEKEMMTMGFVLMGLSTIALSFIHLHSVAIWALILLVTRIGAATAEVMMETYFFKTVSYSDSAALGIFRITRPVSYFIAPIISIVGLMFTTDTYLFTIIGVISLIAVIPAMMIRDTN
ncbi:MAG: MFS transporter [Candidatus Taylorbacteria bacterium]|nr:MFS transporter [Candidatus Taylorbacteria bacterium]